MITAKEFQGLAKGKMRGKLSTEKPSVNVPRKKSTKKSKDPSQYPPDYPQRRSGTVGGLL